MVFSIPMRSLIPFRPGARDFEWIGARYLSPNKVREGGEVIQPEVILWFELPRGVVVSVTVINPRAPVTFEKTLAEAMKHPAEGASRRPARIRVPEQGLADALKGTIDRGTTVVVAPVPELDVVFADLAGSLTAEQPFATFLADGAIAPDVVGDLFSAASAFFRAAPWRHVSEEQVLRVDIPALQVEGACLCVIGGAGESFGLLLFRSMDAYVAFASRPPLPATEETLLAARARRETQLLSLSFDRRKALPPPMLREIQEHGWEVAGAKAYPSVMAADADALPQQATERECRVLTACAIAFLAFFVRHRDLFEQDEPEKVCESFTGDDGVAVTITAPYGDESIGAHLDDYFDFDEDTPVESVPARQEVGRNDPCPCGSGKKYKKCHLNAGPPAVAGAPSPHETPHQMDFRLARAIAQFAMRRFGDAWLGRLGDDFEDDEAALQLFLPWVAWAAVADGKRVAQHYFEANRERLSEEERGWFDAQARAWLSVWEVTRVEPGTVDVRDLLTGQMRSVQEIEGSRILVPRDTVLVRMVDFRGASLFGGMYGRALPPMEALEVVRGVRAKLRAGSSEVAIERLMDPLTGRFLIDRWRGEVAEHDRRAAIPPRLENTDGEALLFVTDSFTFDAAIRSEIETRLAAMDGVDNVNRKKKETEVVYIKPGNRVHRSWENTVIGRAIVGRDSLLVETNSEPRADALGRRIRDACAGLLGHPSRDFESPSEKALASRAASKPRAMSSREEGLLREAKEAHYRDWIDTPVPALGGRTPRSAARSRTKTSREKLDLLLRDMENHENHLPAARRFDVARLRKELGLDAAK